MTTWLGGCFCGAVLYEVRGEPRRVTHCHCLHCRRGSGAPFVTWAEFDPSGFAFVAGEPGTYASRPGVTRTFCRDCGTQLTYGREDEPDTLDISAGSLEHPENLELDDHVWCDRMLPWLVMEDGLPRSPRGRDGG